MSGAEIAQMLLDRDGYIVMLSYKTAWRIGDVIRDAGLEQSSSTPGPFVVIGMATRQEVESQMMLVPEHMRWPIDEQGLVGIYKVTAE